MNNIFQITKESSIMLYGALNIGVSLLKALKAADLNVQGFIDRRADEIEHVDGVPVWSPDDFPGTEETIIIITIKNVFEHVNIVNNLFSKGITNLIYYPYGYGKVESTEFIKIEMAFNSIINSRYNGVFPDLDKINPIPQTTHKIMPQYSFEKYVTEYDENSYILKIPVEFIFTEILDELNNKTKINILALPHVNLFSYFSGVEKSSVDRYFEYNKHTMLTQGFEVTDKWLASNLASRLQVYSEMQRQFVLDPDFFIKNAQDAKWDEEGFFMINGGRHRLSFLISKGYNYLPLKINKSSLDKFQNKEAYMKLNSYLKKNEIEKVLSPVPHPYFYEYPSGRPEYYNLTSSKILQFAFNYFFAEDGFSFPSKTILSVSENYFSLVRYFARIGYNCSLTGQFDKKELLVNKLLNIDSSQFQEKVIYKKQSYDIIYVSIDEYHKVEDIISNTSFSLLFMESPDPKYIKTVAELKSLNFNQLGVDFLNGEEITIGVLYHES